MALTVTINNRSVFGNKKVSVADVDFDDSYPTGGESLTAANLGMKKVELLIASPKSGLQFEYDYANSKLQAFVQGFDTDAAGAGTLDDLPVTAGVGTTTVSVGLTAADPRFGGLVEAASTEDLSTITDVRVFAVGY